MALDRWIAPHAARLPGLVINVGAGEDQASYGRRVVRVDAFAPGVTVRADLGQRLPFRDATFDAAICTEVLEHVPDARLVLQELARVLRPDARLLVSVPFIFHYHADPEDYFRWTLTGLKTELVRAGFYVEATVSIGGRLSALALLLESTSIVAKIAVRLSVFAVSRVSGRGVVVDGRLSPWAQHVAAVARRGPNENH